MCDRSSEASQQLSSENHLLISMCMKKYAEQENRKGLEVGSGLYWCFEHKSHIFLQGHNALGFTKL